MRIILDFVWFVELMDVQGHTLITILIVSIYDQSTAILGEILMYQVTWMSFHKMLLL